jgi:hypothetical protein
LNICSRNIDQKVPVRALALEIEFVTISTHHNSTRVIRIPKRFIYIPILEHSVLSAVMTIAVDVGGGLIRVIGPPPHIVDGCRRRAFGQVVVGVPLHCDAQMLVTADDESDRTIRKDLHLCLEPGPHIRVRVLVSLFFNAQNSLTACLAFVCVVLCQSSLCEYHARTVSNGLAPPSQPLFLVTPQQRTGSSPFLLKFPRLQNRNAEVVAVNILAKVSLHVVGQGEVDGGVGVVTEGHAFKCSDLTSVPSLIPTPYHSCTTRLERFVGAPYVAVTVIMIVKLHDSRAVPCHLVESFHEPENTEHDLAVGIRKVALKNNQMWVLCVHMLHQSRLVVCQVTVGEIVPKARKGGNTWVRGWCDDLPAVVEYLV